MAAALSLFVVGMYVFSFLPWPSLSRAPPSFPSSCLLGCVCMYTLTVRLPPESITIIDCQDDVSLPPILRHQLYQKYKGSKKVS